MSSEPRPHESPLIDRRTLLLGAGAAAAAIGVAPYVRRALAAKLPVFLARNQRYDADLTGVIEDGLRAVGFTPDDFKQRRVLLKPNMVEPARDCPQMTTNPLVVLAAADVFARWGAAVNVGEGPGHVKDTAVALYESGIGEALVSERLAFADLNHEEVRAVANAGGVSKLTEIYFPRAVHEADYIVSMPKLKTHHWVGMTAAMKNLYGVMPGIKYGWPKNVLHHAGIPETVVDINLTLPRTLAIVDAIQCMEGDGPIMGTAKDLGVIAVGSNLAALDATLARVMGLVPSEIPYLRIADGRVGPLDERLIVQHGETWESLQTPFELVDVPWLKTVRDREIGVKTSCRAASWPASVA